MSFEGCKKSEKLSEDQALKQHMRQLNQQFLHRPDTVAAFAAMGFLSKLKKEGHLPGVPKDERGMLRHEKATQMEQGGLYSSVELHYFSKTNIPPRNCYYIVTQVASNSPPKLEKGWATDESGKTIETYSVQ
jgi:hypothetical protein